jgi:hypothetical protein
MFLKVDDSRLNNFFYIGRGVHGLNLASMGIFQQQLSSARHSAGISLANHANCKNGMRWTKLHWQDCPAICLSQRVERPVQFDLPPDPGRDATLFARKRHHVEQNLGLSIPSLLRSSLPHSVVGL